MPPDILSPGQMVSSQSSSGAAPPDTLSPVQFASTQGKAGDAPKRSLMESLPGNKIGQSIGTLGGYLFTELMDHLHGTNNAQYYDTSAPTPMQVGADALNALLTAAIPEAGEATAGVEAASKVAPSFLEKAATLPGNAIRALTPASSAVRSGAVLGGASGGLQSVAEGNTDAGTIGRDAVVGGAFGGLIGLGGKALSSFAGSERAGTGITPQIKTILQTATPEELSQNISAAVEHGKDVTKPNPYGLSQDKLEQAGATIQKKLQAAKQAIGNVLKTDGEAPVSLTTTNPDTGETTNVVDQFKQKVQDMFGFHVVDDFPAGPLASRGDSNFVPRNAQEADLHNYMKTHASDFGNPANSEVSLAPIEGDGRKISPADEKRILATYQELKDASMNPTLRKVNSAVDNIGYQETKGFGQTPDKVDSLLNSTRHDINEAAKVSNPNYAAAKARASELHSMDDLIGEKAGPTLNRGQLLMRRVFYGDQNAASIELLNKIKDETGIDLVKQAGLAKFAIENFGDESQKTGLRQAMSSGARDAQALSGFPSRIIGAATRHISDFFSPDTEKMAMALTKGRNYSLGSVGNKIDDILESPTAKKVLEPIAQGMHDMGIGKPLGLRGNYTGPSAPSDIALTAAKKFLKMYLINRLSQPANVVNGTPPVRSLTQ